MASQLKTRLFFIQMVKNAIYTAQNNNEMLMQYIVQLLSKRVLFGNRHYLEMLQLFTLDHRMLHEHNIRHTEQWLYSYTKTNKHVHTSVNMCPISLPGVYILLIIKNVN